MGNVSEQNVKWFVRYQDGRTHGRTHGLTDGRTDARTDRPHSTIPHELVQWGIINYITEGKKIRSILLYLLQFLR